MKCWMYQKSSDKNLCRVDTNSRFIFRVTPKYSTKLFNLSNILQEIRCQLFWFQFSLWKKCVFCSQRGFFSSPFSFKFEKILSWFLVKRDLFVSKWNSLCYYCFVAFQRKKQHTFKRRRSIWRRTLWTSSS
jgi:hypothetical protein